MNYKRLGYIIVVLAGSVFIKCKNVKSINTAGERKANKVVMALDTSSISLFHQWNYWVRDTNIFWTRISGDSQLYSCSYYRLKDSFLLQVFEPFGFISDFPCTYTFDTSRFWRFSFLSHNDTVFRISSTDNYGNDIINDTVVSLQNLFMKDNPFKKIGSLSSLVDSLDITAISYRSDIGNFLEFGLSHQYKLYYLPDNLFLNPMSEKNWQVEFDRSEVINKNWRLLKVYD
jgi:hypothetical protein